MASATAGIASALSGVQFETPTAAIVANQDGAAYAPELWDGDGWRDRSASHVSMPVRWRTSMATLVELGADAFVEVGYGSMIAALAKRTVPDVPVFSCATPSDLDTLAKELAS
jgi:[acyl-carrier-protein] S-malonyltransferase